MCEAEAPGGRADVADEAFGGLMMEARPKWGSAYVQLEFDLELLWLWLLA